MSRFAALAAERERAAVADQTIPPKDEPRTIADKVEAIALHSKTLGCINAYGAGAETQALRYADVIFLVEEIRRLENIALDDDNYRCEMCERVFSYDDMEASLEEPGVFYCAPCYKQVPFKTDVEHLRPV